LDVCNVQVVTATGRITDLFSPPLFTTTCLLMTLWFVLLCVYYGMMLVAHR
jgi:hypothetical protein